jgi:hypothetical protein
VREVVARAVAAADAVTIIEVRCLLPAQLGLSPQRAPQCVVIRAIPVGGRIRTVRAAQTAARVKPKLTSLTSAGSR